MVRVSPVQLCRNRIRQCLRMSREFLPNSARELLRREMSEHLM